MLKNLFISPLYQSHHNHKPSKVTFKTIKILTGVRLRPTSEVELMTVTVLEQTPRDIYVSEFKDHQIGVRLSACWLRLQNRQFHRDIFPLRLHVAYLQITPVLYIVSWVVFYHFAQTRYLHNNAQAQPDFIAS